MNSYYHARSSASKWGGTPEDYQPIHDFIDSSKRIIGDVRHRSVYHHTEGTFLCERIFGVTITNGAGKQIPTRLIAERHIIEDLGWLPTPADYIKHMELDPWMSGAKRTEVPLSHLLGPTAPLESIPDDAPVPPDPIDCIPYEGIHTDECMSSASEGCINAAPYTKAIEPPPRRRRDPCDFGHMILDKPH